MMRVDHILFTIKIVDKLNILIKRRKPLCANYLLWRYIFQWINFYFGRPLSLRFHCWIRDWNLMFTINKLRGFLWKIIILNEKRIQFDWMLLNLHVVVIDLIILFSLLLQFNKLFVWVFLRTLILNKNWVILSFQLWRKNVIAHAWLVEFVLDHWFYSFNWP